MADGAIRLYWGDKLEAYTLPGMGHGTPIDSSDVGQAAPFILDVGISSSRRIAQFWGLLPAAAARPAPKPAPARVVARQPALPAIEAALLPPSTPKHVSTPAAVHKKIETVIQRALKAAGLIRR
jgi:hypothetical protein